MEKEPSFRLGNVGNGSLLANRQFLALWLAQALSQTAQNALLFGLLVVVLERTNSTIYTSLLVLAYVIPGVFLGIGAGVLVDRWRKRTVLVVTSALRAGTALLFLAVGDNTGLLLVFVGAFAGTGQFFVPAGVSAIPALVPRDKLIAANSLYNLTLTGSQFAGIVFLGPLVIKAFSEDALFVLVASLYGVATLSAALLPPLAATRNGNIEIESLWQSALHEVAEAWHHLRGDMASSIALVQLAMGSSLVLLFAVLVPRYMREVLNVPADNAVFVFAPVGVGALIGLRLLPWFASRRRRTELVAWGFAGISLCLVALGLVGKIADLLGRTHALNPERLGGLSLLVALTMIFAGPLGFFYALVNAPAQTLLHERAPAEMRGRVFAGQMVLASLISIVPLMLIGGITDLYGVGPVLLGVAVAVMTFAVHGALQSRHEETADHPRAEAPGPEKQPLFH